MNIQLLSDLHLEENTCFQPQPAPDADLLVLAGDIGSYQRGSALPALSDTDFGLARFAGWPVPVIYVPGNHEYDSLDFDATHARLRETCEQLGLIWLERETLVLQGVRFIGTTLWTDFDALAPRGPTATLTEQLQAREKAYRAANYYLRFAAATRHGEPFMAEAALEVGLVNRVVPPSEANALAQAQARKLAAKPLSSLIATKQLMKGGQQKAVLERMGEEGAQFGRMLGEPAAREAMTAFMEKRKPDFSKC